MLFANRLFSLTVGGLITVSNSLASTPDEDFTDPALQMGHYSGRLIDETYDFDSAPIATSESRIQLAENEQNDANFNLPALGGDEAETEEETTEGEYTPEQIAEMINNPLGELWLFFTQNDTYSYGGDVLDKLNKDNRIMNSTLLMPVLPFQLTENWKVVARPVIPINSFDVPSDVHFIPGILPEISVGFERETGLGDIVLMTALGTNEMVKPPNIFGFGTTMMFDTASEDELGTGKNSIGPMAMAMHIDDKWIYGLIAQHWESVWGDSDRNDVSLTDLQYIGRYRLSPDTNIGFSPNIRYDWEADSGDRWSIPVGLGMDTMISIGPVPAKIGIEFYHYVKQPDPFGAEWQIRFFLAPVLPSPKWAKTPIF